MPCLRAFGRRAEIRRRSSSVRKLFFLSAAAVFQRNLIDTSLMAASFEFGVQENIDDFAGRVGADEPRRHGADVGVVVAACQRCDFGFPAKGGSDSLMFVQRHRDAVGATAHRDTARQFSFVDGLGQRVGIVRIIAALFRVGAEIVHVVAFRVEVTDYEFFELVAGMVAGYSDFFIVPSVSFSVSVCKDNEKPRIFYAYLCRSASSSSRSAIDRPWFSSSTSRW